MNTTAAPPTPCVTQDSKAIANYVLAQAKFDGYLLSPRELQDLVFMSHCASLVWDGKPLVSEAFIAAEDGPCPFRSRRNWPATARSGA